MNMKNVIRHPKSEKGVFGQILPPGALIKESDVFSSASGEWENCQKELVGGRTTVDSSIVWVRPMGVTFVL